MRTFLLALLLASTTAKAVTIKADKPVQIDLSAADVNRVTCSSGMVNDVFFSEERVKEVSVVRDKVFIKFPIKQVGETLTYASNVVDFDIICDGQAYKFYARPNKDMRGRIVYLGDPRIGVALDNVQQLIGLADEDRFKMLVDTVLSSGTVNHHLFQSLAKENTSQTFQLEGRPLQLISSYRYEGLGLRIKHFKYPASKGEKFTEEMFIIPQISDSARAITVFPLTPPRHQHINIIVIEEAHR